jgi:hypothetical protein
VIRLNFLVGRELPFSHPIVDEILKILFLDFCVYKQKQKELKRQKQEKEECFANLKEREDS